MYSSAAPVHCILSQETKLLDSNGIEQGSIMLFHLFCLYWGSKPHSSGQKIVDLKLVEADGKILRVLMLLLLQSQNHHFRHQSGIKKKDKKPKLNKCISFLSPYK